MEADPKIGRRAATAGILLLAAVAAAGCLEPGEEVLGSTTLASVRVDPVDPWTGSFPALVGEVGGIGVHAQVDHERREVRIGPHQPERSDAYLLGYGMVETAAIGNFVNGSDGRGLAPAGDGVALSVAPCRPDPREACRTRQRAVLDVNVTEEELSVRLAPGRLWNVSEGCRHRAKLGDRPAVEGNLSFEYLVTDEPLEMTFRPEGDDRCPDASLRFRYRGEYTLIERRDLT